MIIGRNEGQRLSRCLDSVAGRAEAIVYVDSGSADGSPALALSRGASVVELDLSAPFTAGRARNEGFARLLALSPRVRYVQFVDGDCALAEGWLETAARRLESDPGIAVVFGNLRELNPHASVYNRLCDAEWGGPPGEAKACGGIAMMRAAAFADAGGFLPGLIAGEEPELCLRLKRRGGRVVRIDSPMGSHDAAIYRFAQWWKRAVRSGYAYAEGAWLHGREPERHWVRESLSAWIWGALIPLAALALAPLTSGLSLALFLLYPLQAARIYRGCRRGGMRGADALPYAAFCVLAKFAHCRGQLLFLARRLRGARPRLVEYK